MLTASQATDERRYDKALMKRILVSNGLAVQYMPDELREVTRNAALNVLRFSPAQSVELWCLRKLRQQF